MTYRVVRVGKNLKDRLLNSLVGIDSFDGGVFGPFVVAHAVRGARVTAHDGTNKVGPLALDAPIKYVVERVPVMQQHNPPLQYLVERGFVVFDEPVDRVLALGVGVSSVPDQPVQGLDVRGRKTKFVICLLRSDPADAVAGHAVGHRRQRVGVTLLCHARGCEHHHQQQTGDR